MTDKKKKAVEAGMRLQRINWTKWDYDNERSLSSQLL